MCRIPLGSFLFHKPIMLLIERVRICPSKENEDIKLTPQIHQAVLTMCEGSYLSDYKDGCSLG